MQRMSNQDADQRDKADANLDQALVRAMANNPDGTQSEWGITCGCAKGSINKKLHGLKKLKLVEPSLGGKWRLTIKGQKEAEQC
jgi:hypothetical protein